MSRNDGYEKISHKSALEACVEMHSLTGYIRLGPLTMNLLGVIGLVFSAFIRVVASFYDIPSVFILLVDLFIFLSVHFCLLPTTGPLFQRISSYVISVFKDENQIQTLRTQQKRNFYSD